MLLSAQEMCQQTHKKNKIMQTNNKKKSANNQKKERKQVSNGDRSSSWAAEVRGILAALHIEEIIDGSQGGG